MSRNKNEENSRTWACILYDDDETMRYAIEALKSGAYNCAGILHDKDLDINGNLKKPHYHFVVRFPNAIGKHSLCIRLQLKENYCMSCNSFKGALEYLTHINHPDKHLYSLTECFGSLVKTLKRYVDDDTEDERALKIIALLDKVEGYVSMRDLIKMCAEEGLFADLRRSGYLFTTLLKEHNEIWI